MQNGYELRKKFSLYLLNDYANETKDNIYDIVWEYLKRIKYILIRNRLLVGSSLFMYTRQTTFLST